MKGYLRQELRELEVLGDITRLRFEGKPPISVSGLYRRRLIRSFYAWKTHHRDPAHFHPAMRCNNSMGPRVPDSYEYSEWKPSVEAANKRKNAVLSIDQNNTEQIGTPTKKLKSAESADTVVERVAPTPRAARTRPLI
jgi:hypothetical protein